MSAPNPFEVGLEPRVANHAPLTPLVFLDWCADVYPDRLAVVHGRRRYTWAQTAQRCRKVAEALVKHGIGVGDTVAVLASNTPEMLELHFAVPMTGAVLNTLNTRLDAATLSYGFDHAQAKVLIVDREFSAVARQALESAQVKPWIIDIDDPEYDGPGERLGAKTYEDLIDGKGLGDSGEDARGDSGEDGTTAADGGREDGGRRGIRRQPADEWQTISLNYTSGTTGNPKGVVYHHRGAYLNAVGNILTWGMPRHSVYLWTLPMFHANGWCFPWTMAANAGTSVCLRRVEPAAIFRLIAEHRVTHYCGAPVVHNMLLDAPQELRDTLDHPVAAMVAGAPPPAAMIEGMERIGIELTHAYGLTETYGPATFAAKQDDWPDLDVAERARRNGRQGVRYLLEDAMTVLDVETGEEVPADGETVGEIAFRGNIVMKGYLKNPAATEEAFAGGWYHSGDLAVREPDGYVKIRDRAKDVIISGGENISSVEVEDVLYRHPAVAFAGVVARPDPKWGETPVAYVELKPGAQATEAELIDFCRQRLAGFKIPRTVVFDVIPRTSTGKIQKNVLRARSRSTEAFG